MNLRITSVLAITMLLEGSKLVVILSSFSYSHALKAKTSIYGKLFRSKNGSLNSKFMDIGISSAKTVSNQSCILHNEVLLY